MIGWVAAIVLLHPLAASLYKVTDNDAAANLPSSASSTKVAAVQDTARRGYDDLTRTATVAVVVARDGGFTSSDRAAVASARAAVGRLHGDVAGLSAPTEARFSPDGQAAAFTATVTSSALHSTSTDAAVVRAVRRAATLAITEPRGLQIAVTGSAAIDADSGNTSQDTLLITALVIVGLVLLVVYRSVVLWVFPLLGALGGIVIAQAATHGLGSAGLTVSTLSTSILIVLAFGAASDYALLLIHRYRDELHRNAAVEDAMAVAVQRTLPTLAASAGTVVGAMLCLLAAQSASLHGLGPVGAVAIVSALLAQTTFLPAMLLIVGRAAFWPRRPHAHQAHADESRTWIGIGKRIARHPRSVAVAASVALCALSVGLIALRVDNNPLDNLKGQPDSVTGASLFSQHFGSGALAPLTVLVPPKEAGAAAATARSSPDVAQVMSRSSIGSFHDDSVTLTVDPYSRPGSAAISTLRGRLDRAAPGTLVGGDPAIRNDIGHAAGRDAAVLIPLILVLIFIVVAVLLRAVIAALVLVLTTALSFAASLALSGLLWRYGLGYSGIEAQLPVYVFVFLVALGVDYNIFLAARIREEACQIGTPLGTLRGLAVTGGVITAAGVVLAGTFAALAQRPLIDLTEVGTAIAIGVLLDTLLVRTVLVPALFLTIGQRLWWPAPLDQRANRKTGLGRISAFS